ncbi:hypothetical protein ACN28E_49620 [Archangium lansingense]|uniref:hypothetical protein n=1 Tax=Archangium lansingense TaxID=2995310 RepID=UPI003B7C4263
MMRLLILCALVSSALFGCHHESEHVLQLIPSPNGAYQAVVLDCAADARDCSTLLKVIRAGEPKTRETRSVQEMVLTRGVQPRIAWMSDSELVIEVPGGSSRPTMKGEVSFVLAPWRATTSLFGSRLPPGAGMARTPVPTGPPALAESVETSLDEAVRKGLLRRANLGDKKQWETEMARLAPERGLPPGTGEIRSLRANSAGTLSDAYVVLRPMTLPAGLYGAHSAAFFVPKGTARPRGNPGHSVIYDFNDMSCTGVGCG